MKAARSFLKRSNPARAAWVEVDYAAIRENARAIRRHLGGVPLIAVIKSDGYGHGMVAAARALAGEVLGFAVISVAEGAGLRRAGLREPVLVMGVPAPGDWREAGRLGLALTLADSGDLRSAPPPRGGWLRAHIKFDTGMGRLGVPWQRAKQAARALAARGVARIGGVYTHISAATDRAFTRAQLGRFASCLDALRDAGVFPGVVHAANSESVIASPRACSLDAVRPGLLLYGCTPGPRPPFSVRPAMSFKTRVAAVRDVPAGTFVSYGHTWRAPRRSRLAVLPVGYSRGVSRLLSNRGFVLVRGRRAPIRGRVTMDITMADITGVPGARRGDEAVLLGAQGRERITAEEWAGRVGTLAYEVLCTVGRLNERRAAGKAPR